MKIKIPCPIWKPKGIHNKLSEYCGLPEISETLLTDFEQFIMETIFPYLRLKTRPTPKVLADVFFKNNFIYFNFNSYREALLKEWLIWINIDLEKFSKSINAVSFENDTFGNVWVILEIENEEQFRKIMLKTIEANEQRFEEFWNDMVGKNWSDFQNHCPNHSQNYDNLELWKTALKEIKLNKIDPDILQYFIEFIMLNSAAYAKVNCLSNNNFLFDDDEDPLYLDEKWDQMVSQTEIVEWDHVEIIPDIDCNREDFREKIRRFYNEEFPPLKKTLSLYLELVPEKFKTEEFLKKTEETHYDNLYKIEFEFLNELYNDLD